LFGLRLALGGAVFAGAGDDRLGLVLGGEGWIAAVATLARERDANDAEVDGS